MASINLLYVSTQGYHPQGFYCNKGIQVQFDNLGNGRPHGRHKNITIIEYPNLKRINLPCCDIKIISLSHMFNITTL